MDRFDLVSGTLSTTILVGIALASLVGAAALQLRWRLARHRRAFLCRRRVRGRALLPLDPGPIELAGIVEADDIEVPVIRVCIEQGGIYQSMNNRYRRPCWRWKEERRTVVVRSFTLVLHGSGARVRVEADESVHLCARAYLATVTRAGATGDRTWEAQLRQGELVAILGVLTEVPVPVYESEGYRGSSTPRAFALRAEDGARLRVVSESAGAEEDRVMAGRRRTQGMLAGVAALLCLATLGVYVYEVHLSVTAVGTIAGLVSCTTKNTRPDYVCFEAVFTPPPGAADSLPQRCANLGRVISEDPSDRVVIDDRVILTSVPGKSNRCSLGPKLEATPEEEALLLVGFLGLVFTCLLELAGPREKLWYDYELLESEESA